MNFSRQVAVFLFFCAPGAGLFPPDAAAAQAQVLPELQIYVGARSVVDLSPAELVESFPELKKSLTVAPDDAGLPAILQRVGENVDAFFRYLPNTTSVEEVRQEVRRSDGRVVNRTSSKFEYLMLSGSGHSVGLDEYRTNSRGKETKPLGPASGFMLTSSCVWHLVHFHPRYQADCRFRYLGRTSKPEAHVIAFAQKPEDARQVGQVGVWDPDLSGQKIWMLIQGLVWVDP
ncbi:MAG: hypothetical protein FJW35_18705, partial [Acidobacteria bacterium]|nr:hypothetical protein [Acidobacteriota bacterium]